MAWPKGVSFSPEHCAKLSASKKGQVVTEEHREKLRIASTGKKHTAETREKMRGRQWKQESLDKLSAAHSGERNHSWRGGRKRKRNHMLVKSPEHPNADANGYVCEYRLVAEKTHGRYLTREEVVHHINGDETDLTPENLLVMENQQAHARLHSQLQQVSYDLVKAGAIVFDEENGYHVAAVVAGRIAELAGIDLRAGGDQKLMADFDAADRGGQGRLGV